MQARTRVVLVCGAGAIVCLAVAAVFVSQSLREPISPPAPEDAPAFAATSSLPVVEPASEPEPAMLGAECDPEEVRSQYMLGLNLRRLGRYTESEAAFNAALAHEPDNVRVLVNAARTQIDLGHPESAEAHAAKATQLAPSDADAWNVLGRSRWARGDVAGAEAALAQACAVDSNHAWARNNLGLLQLQRGNLAAALPLLEAAVQLDGDVAAFHHNLAIAYERASRPSDATAEYARTLELRPDDPRVQAALARLKSNPTQVADVTADSAGQSSKH